MSHGKCRTGPQELVQALVQITVETLRLESSFFFWSVSASHCISLKFNLFCILSNITGKRTSPTASKLAFLLQRRVCNHSPLFIGSFLWVKHCDWLGLCQVTTSGPISCGQVIGACFMDMPFGTGTSG